MMKEKILGHRVLLKMEVIEEKENVSAGGIILEREKKKDEQNSEVGVVVDIGDTAYKDVGDGSPWVRLGDKVLIVRYNGLLVPHDKSLRIINDEDVLMRIEE